MKQYLGIFFLVLLFFLVIHLITSDKDKIVEGIDPDLDCQGSWSLCDTSCKKTYNITNQQSGGGSSCAQLDGATRWCQAGEDECPGSWHYGDFNESCTDVCSQQNLTCTSGAWGVTNENTFRSAFSAAGEDPDSICTASFTFSSEGLSPLVNINGNCYSNQGPNDSICESMPTNQVNKRLCRCGPPDDADCQGSWSACTSACEAASTRVWTETDAQSGSGAACPQAVDCAGGEGACISQVGSDHMGNFRCFDSCGIEAQAAYTIFTQHVQAGDNTSALQTVCEFVDSVNDVNGGCGSGCTVSGGGSPQSETTLNNWSDSMRRNNGCDGSNVVSGDGSNVESNVESGDEYYISQIHDLSEIIMLCVLFDIYGFTFSSFSQLPEDQRERLYTDESIMNKNYLKNQLIVKLDETCPEGFLHTECIVRKENEILDRTYDGRHGTAADVDDFLNILFKAVGKQWIGERRGRPADSLKKISDFVDIFENKDEYGEEYQEFVDKILDEAGKSSVPFLNEISTEHVGENWGGMDSSGRWGLKPPGMDDLSPEEEEGLSDGATIVVNKVYNQYRPIWNVKALLCRAGAVESLRQLSQPEHCNNQYCVGNADLTKDHICRRLKYLDNAQEIEGNTDDECCDISFFENIWFTIQDVFD